MNDLREGSSLCRVEGWASRIAYARQAQARYIGVAVNSDSRDQKHADVTELQRLCELSWREAGLDEFSCPAIDDLDHDLSRLRLFVREFSAIQRPEFRSFARILLERANLRQIRTQSPVRLGTSTRGKSEVTKLELTEVIAGHWRGGDFGVIKPDPDDLVLWFYGHVLICGNGWNALVELLASKGVSNFWVVVDLDNLALDRGF
jgi:hypothetical protein